MEILTPLPQRFCLGIAGIRLCIDTDQCLMAASEFLPFLQDAGAADVCAVFRRVETLPPIPEQVLHEDNCYRVHPDGKGGYLRSFFDAPRDMTPYAVASYDYDGGNIRVDYLSKGARCVSEMHNSFFHLGFEALLISRKRLCLHASCVDTPLGGILFSGPSGIGKSTQAELWCDYRGAEQINGDRPILSRETEGWLAWGSPYAGSSGCHVNKSCPVTAVVMLKQGPVCTLRRLGLPEAFRAIWSGLTMHSWNARLVECASDLTLDLLRTVPVFEFSCTPDWQAVDYLELQLRKELAL